MELLAAPAGGHDPAACDQAEITRAVLRAAVHAPSVHNTQPWRFAAGQREIGLFADDYRRLPVADPRGRELLISCGAALLTCRIALRKLGWRPVVSLFPDPAGPALVARIGWAELAPPVAHEEALYAQIERRRTHRGGFDQAPLPYDLLSAVREEAAIEGAALQVMASDRQRAALSAVVAAAEHVMHLDGARQQEQSGWAREPGSRRLDGVPATAYPATPEHTEPDFPARDFAAGHGWGLPSAQPWPAGPAGQRRSAGVVCVLATSADEPADWVRAGQALQRALLCASAGGVAAALHSQPLEFPGLREFIRVELAGRRHPQLIVRLGSTSREAAVSVRRPPGEVLL